LRGNIYLYVDIASFYIVLIKISEYLFLRHSPRYSEYGITWEALNSIIKPYLHYFNTEDSINALGNAVSSISEEYLRIAETAVKTYDREQQKIEQEQLRQEIEQEQHNKERELNEQTEQRVHSSSNE